MCPWTRRDSLDFFPMLMLKLCSGDYKNFTFIMFSFHIKQEKNYKQAVYSIFMFYTRGFGDIFQLIKSVGAVELENL